MNSKIIVYLGPSLDVEEARSILPADFRPPVQLGDVPLQIERRFSVEAFSAQKIHCGDFHVPQFLRR